MNESLKIPGQITVSSYVGGNRALTPGLNRLNE